MSFRRVASRCFCAAAALAGFATAPAAAAPKLSESAVLARMPSGFLALTKHRVSIAADGSVGRNRQGWYAIGNQAFSQDWATYAVTANDASSIDGALRIAEYGFAHQQSDGGFEGNHIGGGALFVEDVGHTLLLLDGSDWFASDPATQAARSKLPELRRRESLSLAFLVANRTNIEKDTDAANRIARYADAFYFGGKAEGNAAAMSIGESFLRSFLADQGPDGAFYELKGFDSGYQCASIYLAEILFLAMPYGDPARDQLWSAIVRGMARERRAVSASGAISTFHNTRTGADSLWAIRTGEVHGLDGAHASLAFVYYAAITGDAGDAQAARSVYSHYFPQSVP
jgi:hypothetical protein